jgi:hypothetical protein
MIFSVSNFTMDQKSPDGNKKRSFVSLPREPNGWNKSMCAHDRIPPDPANSRHKFTVTFAGRAFRNSSLQNDPPHKGLYLCTRGTLGQSPLFERPTNSDRRIGHHHHARDDNPRLPRDAGRSQKPPRIASDDESGSR